MKTLRSRLFLFIALLLLLPAIPLSFFISRLLDKSYSIGVNPNVEQALDGALKISAEYYQLHKEKVEKYGSTGVPFGTFVKQRAWGLQFFMPMLLLLLLWEIDLLQQWHVAGWNINIQNSCVHLSKPVLHLFPHCTV